MTDKKTPILENVSIVVNPENSEEIIFRTDNEQTKLPFLVDSEGAMHFFDLEG